MHMEVDMELSKKTTILFSPDLHERLAKLATERGVSIGKLVRTACERQYGLASREERLAAVDRLAALALPVGTPEELKRESIPEVGELP
jgi:predicted DNA-binding protein